MDEARRADVEAARRLRGEQHHRVEGELARQQRLLQVAARQRAGARHRARAADVEGADLLLGEARGWRRGSSRPRRLKAGVADARQHHAVGERQAGDQPGRSCGPPGCGRRRSACTSRGVKRATGWPPIAIGRRSGVSTPAITSASARWPLPDTPAMPRISPARTRERDVAQRRAGMAARSRRRRARSTRPRRRAGGARGGDDLVAAHQPRHLGARSPPGHRRLAGDAAVAQHHAAVGERPHLVELVRDEDDAEPLRRHGAQRREQAVDLARRQHGGRLVEDQEAGAAKQRLDDLQPLLLADRRASPTGASGSSVRPKCAADLGEPRRPAGAVEPAAPPGQADQQVLQHRQARRELEMLVHHADAERPAHRPSCGCAPAGPRSAIVPGIGRIGAEQDVHQRGLAGAVLAEQAEDLARRRPRGRPPSLACTGAEALGDAAHGDRAAAAAVHLGSCVSRRPACASSTSTRKLPSMISCLASRPAP